MNKAKEKSEEKNLEDVSGIRKSTANKLEEEGIDSVEDVADSSVSELTEVEGIGEKTAEKLVRNAQKEVGEVKHILLRLTPEDKKRSARLKLELESDSWSDFFMRLVKLAEDNPELV